MMKVQVAQYAHFCKMVNHLAMNMQYEPGHGVLLEAVLAARSVEAFFAQRLNADHPGCVLRLELRHCLLRGGQSQVPLRRPRRW